jgi:hypothetical protein
MSPAPDPELRDMLRGLRCVQAGWAFGVPEDAREQWLDLVTAAIHRQAPVDTALGRGRHVGMGHPLGRPPADPVDRPPPHPARSHDSGNRVGGDVTTPDPDSPVVAYCAPGLKAYAERLLDTSGETYREVIEHPWMAGRADVILAVDRFPWIDTTADLPFPWCWWLTDPGRTP